MTASPASADDPFLPSKSETDEPPKSATRKPRRRWTQVSLGGLLCLVVGIALVLAARNLFVRPYVVQAEAEAALLELGARLESEPGSPPILGWFVGSERFHRTTAANLEHSRAADKDLVHLHRLPWLDRLYLAESQVTNAGLEHVGYCEKLKRISLWGNPITDQGMAHIGRLKNLEALDIHNTLVTDAGLAPLAGCPNLAFLKLPLGVTGDGLESLAGSEALLELNLSRSGVRDRGAGHLAKLTGLRVLRVSTFMTDGSMPALAKCPALAQLNLIGNRRITAEGLLALSENQLWEIPGQNSLLNNSRPETVTQALLRQKRLTNMNLDGAGVTQADIDLICRLRRLDTLSIIGPSRHLDLTRLPERLILANVRRTPAVDSTLPENQPTWSTSPDGWKTMIRRSPNGNDRTGATEHVRIDNDSNGLAWGRNAADRNRRHRMLTLDRDKMAVLLEGQIQLLSLSNCELTRDAVALLAEEASLDTLLLQNVQWSDDFPRGDGSPQATDRDGIFPARTLPRLPHLKSLDCGGGNALAIASDITAAAEIENLRIVFRGAPRTALSQLHLGPHAIRLNLRGRFHGSPEGPSTLRFLADAPELASLYLPGLIATEADLAELVEHGQRLENVTLDGVNLTLADVEPLLTLPKIREIHLLDLPITPEQSAEFYRDRKISVVAF